MFFLESYYCPDSCKYTQQKGQSMVTHRNCLRLLMTLSFFMFFGSIQVSASQQPPSTPPSYWEYVKIFFWNGSYPSSVTIFVDEKKENHRLISDVVITTVIGMATYKIFWPFIDQIGDEIGAVAENYLPNVWPITTIKEKNKEKREQETINKMLADYEYQQKIEEFKSRTGIADFKDFSIKTTPK